MHLRGAPVILGIEQPSLLTGLVVLRRRAIGPPDEQPSLVEKDLPAGFPSDQRHLGNAQKSRPDMPDEDFVQVGKGHGRAFRHGSAIHLKQTAGGTRYPPGQPLWQPFDDGMLKSIPAFAKRQGLALFGGIDVVDRSLHEPVFFPLLGQIRLLSRKKAIKEPQACQR